MLTSAGINFDVSMFGEIWDAWNFDGIVLLGYNIFIRKNRALKRKGGVVIQAQSNITVFLFDEVTKINNEYVVLALHNGSTIFCVCVIAPNPQ